MNLRLLLETLRAEANLPALAAFVASRDSILAADVTGARRADQPGDLLTLADFFQIGSNAKAMLAAACATLIEEGALTWDATPADFFPDLAETTLPGYRRITLEMLLTHRAGLPSYTDTDDLDFILPDFADLPPQEQPTRFAAFLLQSIPPAPQDAAQYSNAGYSLAAAMAERASGVDWQTLLRQRVFDPLGIQAYAGCEHPARIFPNQPWGHLPDPQGGYTPHPPNQRLIPPCLAPAGDVCLPPLAYARFLQMQLRLLQYPRPAFAPLHHRGEAGIGAGWGVNRLRG
ncbi:serine hydrolase, partial [Chloroflexus sp.]|uniref:serine hydrolase domain-containing protein n=1 Tax=Chloroflexus sp. TaxID=1904827 RepID=UPI00258B62A5